jgi:biotin transport system substrate-specific component
MCVCAWIAIPAGDTVFTMQTFAVFLTLYLLGGKWGTAAIAVYLLLGIAGLPVFTGFRGGLGTLLGATGGYLTGFLFSGLVYWLLDGEKVRLWVMLPGLFLCYLFGTLWYSYGYLSGSQMSVWLVIGRCVLPYLLPDGVKLVLAWSLARRLKPYI